MYGNVQVIKRKHYLNKRTPGIQVGTDLNQQEKADREERDAQPIRDPNLLRECREYFPRKLEEAKNKSKQIAAARNNLIFTIGLNTAFRITDILSLKWGHLLTDEKIVVWEKKTGKKNVRYVNSDIGKAVELYQKQIEIDFGDYSLVDYHFEDYIFPGSGKSGHLTIQRFNKILELMKEELNIPHNFSSHSMRKTFCYWYLTNNKNNYRALDKLCELLNHDSISTTLIYAGFSADENKEIFDDMAKFYDNIDNGIVKTYDDKITVSKGQINNLLRYAYSLGKEPVKDFNTDIDNLVTLKDMLVDLEL